MKKFAIIDKDTGRVRGVNMQLGEGVPIVVDPTTRVIEIEEHHGAVAYDHVHDEETNTFSDTDVAERSFARENDSFDDEYEDDTRRMRARRRREMPDIGEQLDAILKYIDAEVPQNRQPPDLVAVIAKWKATKAAYPPNWKPAPRQGRPKRDEPAPVPVYQPGQPGIPPGNRRRPGP